MHLNEMQYLGKLLSPGMKVTEVEHQKGPNWKPRELPGRIVEEHGITLVEIAEARQKP